MYTKNNIKCLKTLLKHCDTNFPKIYENPFISSYPLTLLVVY